MDLTPRQAELLYVCRKSEDYSRLMVWDVKPEDVELLIEVGYLKQSGAGVVTTTDMGMDAYYADYDKRKA